MRKLLYIAFLVSLLTACKDDVVIDNEILQFIPEGTTAIVSTDDLSELRQFKKSSALYKKMAPLARIKEIEKAAAFLADHKLNETSLIALSIEGKNRAAVTLIAPAADELFIGDKNAANPAPIDYNGFKINIKTSDKTTYYSITHKGFYLASSSQMVIESLVRRELDNYVFDNAFATIYSKTSSTTPSIYVTATQENWLEQFLLDFNPSTKDTYADWYQLELINTDNHALELDGLLTYRDSTKHAQKFYNKLKAAPNRIQHIAPFNARYLKAITYDNPEQLLENLKINGNKVTKTLTEIITNSTEISEVAAAGNRTIICSLLPYETLFIDLAARSRSSDTYRDFTIYNLKNAIATTSLQPMVTAQEMTHASVVNDYLILGPNAQAVEHIIANYQSQAVYAKQGWWEKLIDDMSESSTLLYISSMDYLKDKGAIGTTADQQVVKNLESTTYPAMISQYVHENEYAQYHVIIPKATKADSQPITSQLATYKSDNTIVAGPFLFPNHNTGRNDVAFQDATGNLVLVSDNGTKLWSIPLDGTILGNINAVDGLKNERYQLVFSTNKALYHLDRDGNAMKGFPIKFRDAVTQPVSVFDYDNNRDYRLLIAQGKSLIMYDLNANRVSGFKYNTGGIITTQPFHIKVSSDDYIAFAKADNTIAILNRTGGSRTRVKQQVPVAGKLYEYKNQLTAKTTDNELVSINVATGAVTKNGSISSDAQYAATGSIQIITSNNKVTLNGQNVSIPFGSFENLQVAQLNDVPYAHFIESGEKKAYVVGKNARVVESMPVFGTRTTAVAQSKFKYLVTLDGNDVIIYKW